MLELMKFNREHGLRVKCEVSTYSSLFSAVDGVVGQDAFVGAFVSGKLPADLLDALLLGSLAKLSTADRKLCGDEGLRLLQSSAGLDHTLAVLRATAETLAQDRKCVEHALEQALQAFGEDREAGGAAEVGQEWMAQVSSFIAAFESAAADNDRYDEVQRKRQRIEQAKKQREEELQARRDKRAGQASAAGGGGSLSGDRRAVTLQRRTTPRQSGRVMGGLTAGGGGGGVLDDLMTRVATGQVFLDGSADIRAKVCPCDCREALPLDPSTRAPSAPTCCCTTPPRPPPKPPKRYLERTSTHCPALPKAIASRFLPTGQLHPAHRFRWCCRCSAGRRSVAQPLVQRTRPKARATAAPTKRRHEHTPTRPLPRRRSLPPALLPHRTTPHLQPRQSIAAPGQRPQPRPPPPKYIPAASGMQPVCCAVSSLVVPIRIQPPECQVQRWPSWGQGTDVPKDAQARKIQPGAGWFSG